MKVYPAISTFAVQICYTNKFLLSTSQWKKIGDVVGSSGGTPSTSGKALHNGKVAYSIYLHN
jgi:hypothetical protein